MMRYGESPLAGSCPPERRNDILHVTLALGDEVLAGADAPPEHYQKPQGFSVTLGLDDPAEAERIFHALAEGGEVRMPLQETFWAQRFGMLVDRFGTPWMINCGKPA
jgi:PhnB protein